MQYLLVLAPKFSSKYKQVMMKQLSWYYQEPMRSPMPLGWVEMLDPLVSTY